MIIFDFDGVIADSSESVLLALNTIAHRRGAQPLAPSELKSLTTRQLFLRLNIPWYQIPYWVKVARELVHENAHSIAVHGPVQEALGWAAEFDVPLAIVSSNSEMLIRSFLTKHLPAISFVAIIGRVGLGKKHRHLRRLVEKEGRTKGNALYVGDEISDITSACKAGLKSIAVTWGKDSESNLRASNPTWVVGDGEAFLRCLREAGVAT